MTKLLKTMWWTAVVVGIAGCGVEIDDAPSDEATEDTSAEILVAGRLTGRPVDGPSTDTTVANFRLFLRARSTSANATVTAVNNSGFRVRLSGSGTCGGLPFTISAFTVRNHESPQLLIPLCTGGSQFDGTFTTTRLTGP